MVCTFALFAESPETRTCRINRRLGVGVRRREDVVRSMRLELRSTGLDRLGLAGFGDYRDIHFIMAIIQWVRWASGKLYVLVG